ncbi:hypothetical protein [Reyranella sp.]|uniref:hypothetical protein n=1 Tax=Reyranella sp. TaxID=1929291 RepID=UPI003BAACD1E
MPIEPARDETGDEVSAAPEVIRQKTIQVLGERIKLLGVDRSGAYEHYNLQLASGFPIPVGERAILDLVRTRYSFLRSYHEIGSGLGTLPLMLAHDGFASVGIERDERRHLTATAILRELSADLPHIESNCRLLGAPFPDAVNDLDVSHSMAILTDFVASQTSVEYVRLCRGLAQYRYVLLDLQRFCTKRNTPLEREKLVEEFRSYGLLPTSEIIDLEAQGFYQLFECSPPADRHYVPTEIAEAPTSEGSMEKPVAAERALVEQRAPELPSTPARTALQTRPTGELTVHDGELDPPRVSTMFLPRMPRQAKRRRFGGLLGLSALIVIGIPALLAVIYYGYVASNQYVTSFQFAVRGPSQAMTGRSGAAMMGATAMSPDSFVVTDYLNSAQAITDVERDVNLQAMFSRPWIDFGSRLPADPSAEELKAYWAKMVSAQFDLISGNITVSVRAFTPQDSLNLAKTLVTTSDEMFRRLNAKAQQDFVRIADESVARAQEQLATAREALREFRQQSGLVNPDQTAQAGAAIIDDQRKELAGLQTQYAAIKSATPNSPLLKGLQSKMVALEAQIKKDDPLGSSTVKAVSAEALARHQSLELDRLSAEKQYTEALALRTQAYLTAQNQQSYLALFVAPTLPQKSVYPDRTRAIAAVVLAAALAWFVGVMITYALRDHLM